jgi:hypothetical protein
MGNVHLLDVNLGLVLAIYTKCCYACCFEVFALPFQDIGSKLAVCYQCLGIDFSVTYFSSVHCNAL